MKKVFYFCMIAAVAVTFSFLTGCAAPGSGAGSQPENLPAILINEAQVESKKIVIGKDATRQLSVSLNPSSVQKPEVIWSVESADGGTTDVISVDEEGLVTGLKEGTAKVRVTLKSNSKVTASCEVQVLTNVIPAEYVVYLNPNSDFELNVNTGKTLSTGVYPETATCKDIIYTSSNPEIATVNSKGRVYAVSEGTATITATVNDGSGTHAEITVTTKFNHIKQIDFFEGITTCRTGDVGVVEVSKITGEYSGSLSNSNLKWSINDTSVAELVPYYCTNDFCKFKTKKAGTFTLTAEACDGGNAKRSVTITVNPIGDDFIPVERIEIEPAVTVTKGNKYPFDVKFYPENATNKLLYIEVSDYFVAEVDWSSTNCVQAKDPGTTTVTFETHNGKTATCEFTVTEIPATSITINITEDTTMLVGEQNSVSVTNVVPSNYCKEYVYFSSKPEVASIDSKGIITAVGVGTTSITVKPKYYDKESPSAQVNCVHTFKVIVKDSAYPVIDYSAGGKGVGNKQCFAWPGYVGNLSVSMADGSSSSYTWTSSNPDIIAVDQTGKLTYKSIITTGVIADRFITITVTAANGATDSIQCLSTLNTDFTVGDKSVNNNGVIEFPVSGLVTDSQKSKAVVLRYYRDTTSMMPIIYGSYMTFTSSNTSVAKVEAGTTDLHSFKVILTGTLGVSEISAKVGGIERKFTIGVTDVSSVSLNKSITYLVTGKTETLTATVSPSSATNKNVVWKSSNTAVATVDSTGKVTAIKSGTATITATSATAPTKKATCTVNVSDKPSVIVDFANSWTDYDKDEKTLTFTGAPGIKQKIAVKMNDGSSSTYTWTSSDTSVATVDNSGNVTFTSVTTSPSATVTYDKKATITVTAANGTSATFNVRSSVYNLLYIDGSNSGTSFSNQLSLSAGASKKLNLKYYTANNALRDLNAGAYTCTSSNSSIVKVEKVTGLYGVPYQIQITGVAKGSCQVSFDVGGVKKSVVVNVQ